MPEKIGKYQVIERIGRGGMGMIFKAHDPVLDRAVALKVISTEIEVTDELRARFFREAQAWAQLSHPNIVAVYDMGEDDGRFFIVMEFLEGEELRRLITDRTPVTLEDKLAVMLQICDGLHYAHQKGVVHRDIKPGNIFLLRDGQAKILDFGIAQIATTEAGLTRTGLIMGTLRYISPEQVRGRADHRSDIFSIGAVFYEFLSFRPAFTGEDPMQILEQLRADDPPPLSGLDPTIPPNLAAIVERAMRKDPAERFADLGQMRDELKQVQRGIIDEAQRVWSRLRGRLDQVRGLQAALAARIGWPPEPEQGRAVTERAGLQMMQALDREVATSLDALRAKMAQADALTPGFQRGTELLRAGRAAAAVVEFEAIVADMPEHALAQEGLRGARAHAEGQRRQQLAAKLLQDARGALDDGGYAVCLGILKQAEEIPAPAEAAPQIASLRQAAEAGLVAQAEKQRRDRDQADRGRRAMEERRRSTLAADAAAHAPSDWREAEASAVSGETAFASEAYAEASHAFDLGLAQYGRAEERTREAVRARADAEKGREAASVARRTAADAHASKYAAEPWTAGEGAEARANAALGRQEFDAARQLFTEARRTYAAAAQAAGVAAEAESRLGDARRLLESGDITACLRLVDDVLALRPGHEAAERLRAQAEETLRQAKTVAPEAEALAQDATVRPPIAPDALAERPTELVEAPAVPTLIIPVPPLRAEPPTVAARTPTAEAAAPPVNVEQRAAPPAIPERPRAARDAVTGPRKAIAWPSGRALKAGGLVLGGLTAAMIAIVYWQAPWAPPVSAPVPRATPAPTSAPPVVRPAEPSAAASGAEQRQIAARKRAEEEAERAASAEQQRVRRTRTREGRQVVVKSGR